MACKFYQKEESGKCKLDKDFLLSAAVLVGIVLLVASPAIFIKKLS